MTGKEVYKNALALLFEDEAAAGDYNTYALPLLNMLLPELLGVNNQLRVLRGKEALDTAPVLKTLDAPLEYEPELCRAALPFGLASRLVYDDNDLQKVAYFNSAYVNAVNALSQTRPEPVKDVYL